MFGIRIRNAFLHTPAWNSEAIYHPPGQVQELIGQVKQNATNLINFSFLSVMFAISTKSEEKKTVFMLFYVNLKSYFFHILMKWQTSLASLVAERSILFDLSNQLYCGKL